MAEWDYIAEFEEHLDNVTSKKRSGDGRSQCVLVTKDGNTYATISGKDPMKIARLEPHIIIGAEASRLSMEAFSRIWARGARQEYFTFLGTGSFEESRGPFWTEYNTGLRENTERLASASIPAWANRHKYPGGADDSAIAELRISMSEERFNERIKGEPAAPRGAVIRSFRPQMHINDNLAWEPGAPVYLGIDPGTLCYAILMVQFVRGEIRVMDGVYENSHDSFQMIRKAQLTPGWKWLSTTPGDHVMDFAGRQSHAGDRSPYDIWKNETAISMSGKVQRTNDVIERINSLCNFNPETGRPFLQIKPPSTPGTGTAGLIAEMGGGESPLASMGLGQWMRVQRQDGTLGEPEKANNHALTALAFLVLHHFGSGRIEVSQTSAGTKQYDVGAGIQSGASLRYAESPYSQLLPGGNRPARTHRY